MSLDNRFDDRKLMPESRLIPAQVDFSRDYDADSFKIKVASPYQKYLQSIDDVRLVGIDAPETSHTGGKDSQYYGLESKRVLKELLPSNGQIYLRVSGDISKAKEVGDISYKARIMGEAFYKNPQGSLVSLNQELVRKEAAYLYDSRNFRDHEISTPELEKEYYAKVEQYLQNPAKEGLFSSQALYPEDYRAIKQGRMSPFLPPKALDRLKENLQNYKARTVAESISNSYGITNSQLTPFFNSDSQVKFIIPSQYGSSYFYERAIYAANRERAGLSAFNITETQGPATSAYLFSYMNKNAGQLPKVVPWYVSNYDREMATPGLSYYINKEAIKHGWGRIYQEEKGPLASLAGAIGKVLDNSLIYYGNTTPDYIRRQQEINPFSINL